RTLNANLLSRARWRSVEEDVAEPATKRVPAITSAPFDAEAARGRVMPIKIPDDLPAFSALAEEGVMVMRETDAIRQDIRPLRIGLLNLMPNKIRTETQIARLLGATPLQVALPVVRIANHVPRSASSDHMISFCQPWEDIRADKFDVFVVTGSPVEKM